MRLVETDGERYGDVAVFYRTNAQSRVIEEQLVRAGVPYRVVGGVKFYDRREVKDLLAYLRALVNPDDEVSWRRVVNTPKRGVGETSVNRVAAYAHGAGVTFREGLQSAAAAGVTGKALGGVAELLELMETFEYAAQSGVAATVEAVLEETGYVAELEAEHTVESQGRIENLQELVGVCREFDEALAAGDLTGLPGIAGVGSVNGGSPVSEPVGIPHGLDRVQAFLEAISLVTDLDSAEGAGTEQSAVTLMTMHSAKGLEFPVVFITGMEDGVFPHLRSLGDPDELEEERRLCYVGITRARDRLYLCHAWSGCCSAPPTTTRRAASCRRFPKSSCTRTRARGQSDVAVATRATRASVARRWSRRRWRPRTRRPRARAVPRVSGSAPATTSSTRSSAKASCSR